MAKLTWLGEDDLHGGGAGPSFTMAFGQKFPKGEAVEVTDPDTIERAKKSKFFKVSNGPGRPPLSDAKDSVALSHSVTAAKDPVNVKDKS